MNLIEFIKNWWPTAASIIAIIGVAFLVRNHIDNAISQRLENPEFLERIAKLVRPSLIFDSGESVVVDQGAGKFISDISIEYSTVKGNENSPIKITLELTKHFAYAPLVTPIQSEFTINSERGKGNSWVFVLNQFDNYQDQNNKYQFRVELLQ